VFAEGSFSQAFVPILTRVSAEATPQELEAFLARTAGSLVAVLSALTALGIVAAPLLVLAFAPGFARDGQLFALTEDMVRLTFPYLFFITLTAFAGAILNVHQQFAAPAFTPVLLNLTMIAAAVWVAPHWLEPVYALAWAVLVAGVMQLAFQLPFLARLGMLPRLRWGFGDPAVRRVIRLLGPAVVSVSVTQVNVLLNTLIASFLVSGSVSWLYYSDRLVEFPVGILGVAVGTVMLPHLSKSHADEDSAGFSQSLDAALRSVCVLAFPATLGLVLLARPLLFSLFQYEHFSVGDVEMTSRSLVTYAAGILGFVAARVLMSGFTARHDFRTPFRFGVSAIAINVALSLVLVYFAAPEGWGHAALALATAIAGLINAAMLLQGLLHAGAFRPEAGWGVFLARLIFAAAVMAILLRLLTPVDADWAGWQASRRIGQLALLVAAGAIAYGCALLLAGFRPRHLRASANP
jgi:putative peptidoglycan lipid II flippase